MMRSLSLSVLLYLVDAKRVSVSLELENIQQSNASEADAADDMCSCHTDLMPAECEMMAFDGLNGRTCDSNKPVNFGVCMASKGLGLVKDCCPASCCAAKAQGKASTGPDKECAPPFQQAENICKAVATDMGKGLRIKKAASGRIGQMWKEACEMNVVADENRYNQPVAINAMGKVVKVDDNGKLTNVEVDGDSFSLPGSKYNFRNGCTLMCGDTTSDEMLAANGGKFECAGKRSCVFLKPVSSANAAKVPPPVPPRSDKPAMRQAPPVPPRPAMRQAPPVPPRPAKRLAPPVPPRPAKRLAPPVPPNAGKINQENFWLPEEAAMKACRKVIEKKKSACRSQMPRKDVLKILKKDASMLPEGFTCMRGYLCTGKVLGTRAGNSPSVCNPGTGTKTCMAVRGM